MRDGGAGGGAAAAARAAREETEGQDPGLADPVAVQRGGGLGECVRAFNTRVLGRVELFFHLLSCVSMHIAPSVH